MGPIPDTSAPIHRAPSVLRCCCHFSLLLPQCTALQCFTWELKPGRFCRLYISASHSTSTKSSGTQNKRRSVFVSLRSPLIVLFSLPRFLGAPHKKRHIVSKFTFSDALSYAALRTYVLTWPWSNACDTYVTDAAYVPYSDIISVHP